MKQKVSQDAQQKAEKIEEIIHFVDANKDSVEAKKIMSAVFKDKNIEPTDENIAEFSARVGTVSDRELQQMLGMISTDRIH